MLGSSSYKAKLRHGLNPVIITFFLGEPPDLRWRDPNHQKPENVHARDMWSTWLIDTGYDTYVTYNMYIIKS